MKRNIWIVAALAIIAIIGIYLALSYNNRSANIEPSMGKLRVVAGENFWGSLISQLGGQYVQVSSIVSDPNADPHEYESNTNNARAFADADYVVLNGAGYDSWGDKLLSAGFNPNRKVLNVADLLGKKEGDNPHFWYDPAYVNQVIGQMEKDLISLDPNNAAYYKERYLTLQSSLSEYQNRILSIKQQFGGVKVAATEDIFAYIADAAGLDLVSPKAFTQAVAEGNDPPANSIVKFEDQLKNEDIKLMVYNQQTVTPLTESIKKLAAEQGIPIIGVTETIQPPDVPFQEWMNSELISINNALNAKVLGQ